MTVLRLQWAKRGPVRFISHRDVARVWERASRRARVPLAFSQGFSPHPKVSFGLALPLGWESDAEYVDVTLADPMGADEVATVLNAVLPEGMSVVAAAEIDPSLPSAASTVQWADYLVFLAGPEGEGSPDGDVRSALEALRSMDRWMAPARRKGRLTDGPPDDLRPHVVSLDVVDPLGLGPLDVAIAAPNGPNPAVLTMRLATQPRVVRPEEVCAAISAAGPAAIAPRLVRRTAQVFVLDGAAVDPLAPVPLPAGGPHIPSVADSGPHQGSGRPRSALPPAPPDHGDHHVAGEKASSLLHAEVPTPT